MERIFVCGDVHGDIDIGKIDLFVMGNKDLVKSDILLVCGDWGAIWDGDNYDKEMIEKWENYPFTTLVTCGNHENYDLIEKLPVVKRFGGRAYKVSETVYIALRGEVFNIYGKTFLSIGGADSHDREWRTTGISWWPQEVITEQDKEKILENIKDYSEVDYIISHTGGEDCLSILNMSFLKEFLISTESDRNFSGVINNISYKNHFCGHYHVDAQCGNNIILYNYILEIHKDDKITCANAKRMGDRDVTKLEGMETIDFWDFSFVPKEATDEEL